MSNSELRIGNEVITALQNTTIEAPSREEIAEWFKKYETHKVSTELYFPDEYEFKTGYKHGEIVYLEINSKKVKMQTYLYRNGRYYFRRI